MKDLGAELLRGIQRRPPSADLEGVTVVPTERTLVTELTHLLRERGCAAVAEVSLPGSNYRPDLLLVGERPVVLEAKPPGTDLSAHVDQAMKYVRLLLELHPQIEPAAVVTDFKRALVRERLGADWKGTRVGCLGELADLLIELSRQSIP
ncbi:hypothetical protein [Methanopyrus sp.]